LRGARGLHAGGLSDLAAVERSDGPDVAQTTANVDLKAFSDDFYRRTRAGGRSREAYFPLSRTSSYGAENE